MEDEVHAFLASVFGEPVPESPEPEPPAMTPERFCQIMGQIMAGYRLPAMSTWRGGEYFSLSLWPKGPGDAPLLTLKTPNDTYALPVELPLCRPAETL